MKTLITGASGNFGSMTLERLLTQMDPTELILMSRKPDKLAEYAKLGCDVRFGDFDRPESLVPAARGAEQMLLISGHKVGHRIRQHGDAIEAAKLAGVRRIAYTSYFGSDEGNTALVCIDHHGTEQLLKASGLAYTILRDGMYGDSIFNAAMPAAIATGQWRMCAGDGKVNLVDRVDCVDSAVAVLTGSGHENRTYNIVGPKRRCTRSWTRSASRARPSTNSMSAASSGAATTWFRTSAKRATAVSPCGATTSSI